MEESELIEKYGIDLESLKREQETLLKKVVLKDSVDLSAVSKLGAIDSILIKNQIISVAIVCDKNFEILEEQYFLDKLKFPYLHEFRSYRELPAMIGAFSKLNDKPDLVLIRGHGLTHPRLGLATHFSLVANIPSIGIAENLFDCDKLEGEFVIKEGKKVGRVLQSKEKANPLFLSSGNGLSLESSYNLVKDMIKFPHKLPEPLHLAHKYAKEVKNELKL